MGAVHILFYPDEAFCMFTVLSVAVVKYTPNQTHGK